MQGFSRHGLIALASALLSVTVTTFADRGPSHEYPVDRYRAIQHDLWVTGLRAGEILSLLERYNTTYLRFFGTPQAEQRLQDLLAELDGLAKQRKELVLRRESLEAEVYVSVTSLVDGKFDRVAQSLSTLPPSYERFGLDARSAGPPRAFATREAADHWFETSAPGELDDAIAMFARRDPYVRACIDGLAIPEGMPVPVSSYSLRKERGQLILTANGGWSADCARRLARQGLKLEFSTKTGAVLCPARLNSETVRQLLAPLCGP